MDINCYEIDVGPKELWPKYMKQQWLHDPMVLGLFLNTWVNSTVNAIKSTFGTIMGYFYELKYLKEVKEKKDFRNYFRIIAVLIRNTVVLADYIKKVQKAYNDIELLQTGLFKVFIDPILPLGFYISIGKLLHKSHLMPLQKIYFKRYNKLLSLRLVTPQAPIEGVPAQDENTGSLLGQKTKDSFKEGAKKLMDKAKAYATQQLNDQSSTINKISESLSYIAQTKKGLGPLGLIDPPKVMYKNTPSDSYPIVEIYRQLSLGLEGKIDVPTYLAVMSYNYNVSVYQQQPPYDASVNIKYLTAYTKNIVFLRPFVPLFILGGFVPNDNINQDEVNKVYQIKLNELSQQNARDAREDGVSEPPNSTIKDIMETLIKEGEISLEEMKNPILYKKIIEKYISLGADAGGNANEAKAKIKLLSRLLVPAVQKDLINDIMVIKKILSNYEDPMGLIQSTIVNARAQNDKPQNAMDVRLDVMRAVLEPMSWFILKSYEMASQYLSENEVAHTEYILVSLEPFSIFIPPLPEVYTLNIHEAFFGRPSPNNGQTQETILKNEISIYRDILPVESFKLSYRDIDTETVQYYSKRLEIPTFWENFLPDISISIYDTSDRHIRNYFSEYRKRVFLRGAARPPLDSAFILDVITMNHKAKITNFLSFIVIPKSLEIPGINYDSDDTLSKVPTIDIDFAVIGFISYTGVQSVIKLQTANNQTNVIFDAASIGSMDFSVGYYTLPTFEGLNAYKNKTAKEKAKLLANYQLIRWYAMYNDMPITGEYLGTLDIINISKTRHSHGIKTAPSLSVEWHNSISSGFFNKISGGVVQPEGFYLGMPAADKVSGARYPSRFGMGKKVSIFSAPVSTGSFLNLSKNSYEDNFLEYWPVVTVQQNQEENTQSGSAV